MIWKWVGCCPKSKVDIRESLLGDNAVVEQKEPLSQRCECQIVVDIPKLMQRQEEMTMLWG